MNSRSCRWLIVSALLITASGAWAQQSAPPASDQKVNQGCEGVAPAPIAKASVGVPRDSAQAALQAQKSAVVPIPHEFTDRALMTNTKWTEETFFQRITSNWDTYTGEQGWKEKDVLRTAEMEICGVVFSVKAVRFKSDGVYQFIFTTKLDERFPKDFREKFMGYAETIWGVPSKDIDYSGEYKEGSVDNHDTEWDLGNTVISFSYFGAEMYGKWIPGLCLFQITQAGKVPSLKDLISLKCEGQRKFSGSGIEPVSSFVIFVDLNHNAILRRDKSVREKNVQVSQDYFVAEGQEKDFKGTFTIDRKLGTYKWRVTSAVNAAYEMNEWGKCEKIDLPTQPKF
jgi:hypothetical protein